MDSHRYLLRVEEGEALFIDAILCDCRCRKAICIFDVGRCDERTRNRKCEYGRYAEEDEEAIQEGALVAADHAAGHAEHEHSHQGSFHSS